MLKTTNEKEILLHARFRACLGSSNQEGPKFCISIFFFFFSFHFCMKKGGLDCLEIISKVFDVGESKERDAMPALFFAFSLM